jgi:hypothetical protein
LLERHVPPQERPQRDVASDKATKGLETMVVSIFFLHNLLDNVWISDQQSLDE